MHDKHRLRVKAEFLNGNYNDYTPAHKWLELLLFYCVPRIDTNPLAHELLAKYKTIDGVLSAPVSELIKFKGITENGAVLLKLIIPIARQCEIEKSNKLIKSLTPQNYGDYLMSRFYGLDLEHFGILSLDALGKIIDFKLFTQNSNTQVGITTKESLKFILNTNAVCAVIAHNHPNGYALPSKTDIDTTVSFAASLSRVNVRLLDHIIIAGQDYVSMAQSKDYSYIFNQINGA